MDLSPSSLEDVDPTACPNVALPVQTPPGPETPDREIALDQAEMRPDMERLQAYIAEHQDVMGDPWYGAHTRIGVTISSNVEEHCVALRALLEHPNELEINSGYSKGTLAGIVAEMQRDWPHAGYIASVHQGRVIAHLWPGEEAAAREMAERYGAAVELWLGRQRYPDGHIQGPCLYGLAGTTDPIVDVDLPPLVVEVGGRFPGVATLTNRSSSVLALDEARLISVVMKHGTTVPLAVVTGVAKSVIEKTRLQPNESTGATFVGGTASCDPSIPFTLPPGNYEYRVLVVTSNDVEVEQFRGFWSDPSSLTVS
jgi:hypothetical protein